MIEFLFMFDDASVHNVIAPDKQTAIKRILEQIDPLDECHYDLQKDIYIIQWTENETQNYLYYQTGKLIQNGDIVNKLNGFISLDEMTEPNEDEYEEISVD